MGKTQVKPGTDISWLCEKGRGNFKDSLEDVLLLAGKYSKIYYIESRLNAVVVYYYYSSIRPQPKLLDKISNYLHILYN